VHKLGGAYFLCLQGIREKREDAISTLWEWIRGARAVVQKLERVDQAIAFIRRADQVGYIGKQNKARKCQLSTDKFIMKGN
jgi:hypothetical protein